MSIENGIFKQMHPGGGAMSIEKRYIQANAPRRGAMSIENGIFKQTHPGGVLCL